MTLLTGFVGRCLIPYPAGWPILRWRRAYGSFRIDDVRRDAERRHRTRNRIHQARSRAFQLFVGKFTARQAGGCPRDCGTPAGDHRRDYGLLLFPTTRAWRTTPKDGRRRSVLANSLVHPLWAIGQRRIGVLEQRFGHLPRRKDEDDPGADCSCT